MLTWALSAMLIVLPEARWRKQTMLFSATLEGAGPEKFAEDLLKDPAELFAEPPRSERKNPATGVFCRYSRT